MRDLSGKVDGSGTPANELTAAEWNDLAIEFKRFLENMGYTLSSGDLDQVGKAIADTVSVGNYYACGGSANSYTLTAVPAAGKRPSAYRDGMLVRFRPIANSTSATPQVNVNSLGAKTITNEQGGPLVSGDLSTTRDAVLRYNVSTAKFMLQEWTIPNPTPPELPRGHINAALIFNSGGDLEHDIQIGAGEVRDYADSIDLAWPTPWIKRIDVNFAFGTNGGGFGLGGGVQANTWYMVHVIAAANGTVDFGFDTSTTAVNLLAAAVALDGVSGWSKFRRLGWVRTDASANIVRFTQSISDPDHFTWDFAAPMVAYAVSTTFQYLTMLAPPSSVAEIVSHLRVTSSLAAPPLLGRLGTTSMDYLTALTASFNVYGEVTGVIYDEVTRETHWIPVDATSRIGAIFSHAAYWAGFAQCNSYRWSRRDN